MDKKLKPVLIGLATVGVLVVLGGAGYGLYAVGMDQGMTMGMAVSSPSAGGRAAPGAADALPQTIAQGEEATRRHIASGIKAGDVDPVTGKKVIYYHDPMVPGNKFDKPAKSPFMDMMLVPVYADGDSDGSKVTVSPRIQQNLGVRTATVTEGSLSPQVSTVGSIAFNERDQAIVQVRTTSYVERLQVRATLDRVAKGQPLAELYVPDWIAAQEEFLSVRRMQGPDLLPLVDSARQRMRQAGMSEAHMALVESSGKAQPRITLVAPIGGVVTELMAREGMTAMPGATLFRINGLSTVWANAEVPRKPGRADSPWHKSTGQQRRRTRHHLARHGAGDIARSQCRHAHAQGARGTGQPRQCAGARHVRDDAVHGHACHQSLVDPDRGSDTDRQAHGGDAG